MFHERFEEYNYVSLPWTRLSSSSPLFSMMSRVICSLNRVLVTSRRWYSRPTLKILRKPLDNSVLDRHGDSILYSSYLEDNVMKLGYHRNRALESSILAAIGKEQGESRKVKQFPVALRHLANNSDEMPDFATAESQMQIKNNTVVLVNNTTPVKEDVVADPLVSGRRQNWMEDYEFYERDEEDEGPVSRYGTADPKVPPSNVPCSGCGARLHCMDESLPGYLPREIFKGRTSPELQSIVCQRCHFLKHYNTALNISVKPEEYEQFLSTIKNRHGLIILIVDLLDIPCSIWPNILDLLGHNRPMFIVGNKVDLIPKDSRGYLDHIKNVLVQHIQDRGIPERNIRHISLISATTGFGVEELVTALHNKWSRDGDVYLCGVTNVGKSSLFNSLLRSDYCKSKASDLMQRATASPWPGTTIKMLKFPILRISDARKYWRTQRLVSERAQSAAESQLRRIQARETGKVEHATLLGHIGQSFKEYEEDQANSFSMGQPQKELFTLDESHKELAQSKWCFDTPGVITPDQMYSLFTIEELLLVKQKEMMRPRTYLMKPGMTLFLAGIARIDFKEGAPFIRAQVYSSLELPILICKTESADQVYQDCLPTEMFKVPTPDEERLKSWPALKPCSEDLSITSEGGALISGDIVLSCCGWIGINLEDQHTAVIKAWTPAGTGIYLRQPAMLPRGMRLKGSRIRHSLAYKTGKAFVKQ